MLQTAAAIIGSSKRLVVLTGAGCSVDAGVPDFRSPSGWWRQINPQTVATVKALEENYELFHAFYSARIRHLKQIVPHKGHEVLSRWEREGRIQLIATQNVDGLHQLAGNVQVKELHGSIRSFRCQRCGRPAEEEAFLAGEACQCGGRLRPNVVLFGEGMDLPQQAWNAARQAIEAADAVLVIGTSLQVSPANQLPYMTKGKLLLINKEETGSEHRFDCCLQGGAEELLLQLDGLFDYQGKRADTTQT
ncbi:SIR2 family NAD-dependent protein deacylase [Paenibacillus tarimensis]|uniref:SIR2 family NAD-dependent protein deacylase n=1 Tax=Paenibacillus tarimensis TaxID=416012 RepID=UPI001F16D66E|nr:NAD-dependent deacylase [Paenibacillus tarimensis]MCF2945385.1 NAD-dependent deacylase [Paenibacillus tarimensis]